MQETTTDTNTNETTAVITAVDQQAGTITSKPLTATERALASLHKAKAPPTTPGEPEAPDTDAEASTEPTEPVESKSAHAKALALAAKREREAYEAKQQAKKLEAELNETKQQAEARKKLNPLELLKTEYGLDYAGLTKAIVEQKYAEQTPEQQALSEHDKELAAIKAELDGYKQEKLTVEQQRIEQENLKYISSELSAAVDRFPLLASMPAHHPAILARYNAEYQRTGEEPSLAQIVSDYEADAEADVKALFSSDAVLKKFLADEATKKRVIELLGLGTKENPQQAQQGFKGNNGSTNGRAPLPHTRASEPGLRSVASVEPNRRSRIDAALQAVSNSRK